MSRRIPFLERLQLNPALWRAKGYGLTGHRNSTIERALADDQTNYHLLRLLEDNPEATQRELAEAMGVSIGKTNYLLRGLMDKGLVKARNFRRSDNKKAYLYQLTPAGVAEKVQMARRYLARRRAEYEQIRAEIEALEAELGEGGERG